MANIISIQSSNNEKLKQWKKLRTKKGRLQTQSLLIEGEHLLLEATSAGLSFSAILLDQQKREGVLAFLQRFSIDVPIYELASELFKGIVETETPQGVAAVVSMPQWSWENLVVSNQAEATYIVVDAVQDPGNLGTMLRTAEAAGMSGFVLGAGTVDPFNSKVVRAAMGSVFRLPILQLDLKVGLSRLKEHGVTIVGTSPHAGTPHFAYSFPQQSAIVLGNEGRGVDPSFQPWIDDEVMIPMPGHTESLNVSITHAILVYERVRQSYPHL
ncbi:TrmH family RNA methyltransferase [Hazenella coriacea]|uniref:TrmH family RNA methyltransferase n=1 Tax=Hazenella coriacea TaxID=1179467 RepID=A0A4R3L9E8_9BACL|nr:RNA methyltransferase [Hazenella coriacea]TCS96691.1 TrmH family RNA methyltransferase [Hazenella coriacea]